MQEIKSSELVALDSLPPRSTLFSLEPIGIGTPDVESLISYFLRLSEAHCVKLNSLYQFLLRLVMIKYSRTRLPKSRISVKLHEKLLIENLGNAALAHLTHLKDLGHLTFSYWRKTIYFHSHLRSRRAWCPECFQDWADNGQPIYDKLLWTIPEVKICNKHLRPLDTHCPHPGCNAETPPLESSTQVGICSRCGGWLGNRGNINLSPLSDRELENQKWVSKQVGHLLSHSASINLPPQTDKSRAARIYRDFVTCGYGHAKSHFFKKYHISDDRRRKLLNKGAIPTLREWLDLSHATSIPLPILCIGDLWPSLSETMIIHPKLRTRQYMYTLFQRRRDAGYRE